MTKNITRIVKMLEKLDSVLQENNENAKAAVMVFKHFGGSKQKSERGGGDECGSMRMCGLRI